MACIKLIVKKIKKIKKNQFIIFFIGTFFLFIYLLYLIIRFYELRDDYIWFNSKILSIRNLTNTLYLNYTIYHNLLDRYTYSSMNYSYYDLLENATKGNCREGLKQCGILDTIGNKLCLPEEFDCPINDIFIDLKGIEHIGYNSTHYSILPYTTIYGVFHTNNEINGNIVASILNTTNVPGFIGNHCFNFDEEAFENKYSYKYQFNEENNDTSKISVGGPENSIYKYFEGFEKSTYYASWYNISSVKVAISNQKDLGDFLNMKFVKAKNRDRYYKKISDGVYVKNFIGFENREQLDLFNNTDFTIYKNLFPDNLRITLIIFYEILLFLSIYIFYVFDKKYFYIYSYFIYSFFVLLFIYICVSYNANKKDFSYLKTINTDINMKDFIKEFLDIIKSRKILFIISLLFLSISLICYIISYICYFIKENADPNKF